MISATSCDILFEVSAFGGVIIATASGSAGEIKTGVLGAFAGAWPKREAAKKPKRMV
jgi:hypothetical protein